MTSHSVSRGGEWRTNTVSVATVRSASESSAPAIVGERRVASNANSRSEPSRLLQPASCGGVSGSPSSQRSQSFSANGVMGTHDSPATRTPSTSTTRSCSTRHNSPSWRSSSA